MKIIHLIFLGESACGQRALYQFGLTGIPIYNVSSQNLKFSFNYIFHFFCSKLYLHEKSEFRKQKNNEDRITTIEHQIEAKID